MSKQLVAVKVTAITHARGVRTVSLDPSAQIVLMRNGAFVDRDMHATDIQTADMTTEQCGCKQKGLRCGRVARGGVTGFTCDCIQTLIPIAQVEHVYQ